MSDQTIVNQMLRNNLTGLKNIWLEKDFLSLCKLCITANFILLSEPLLPLAFFICSNVFRKKLY